MEAMNTRLKMYQREGNANSSVDVRQFAAIFPYVLFQQIEHELVVRVGTATAGQQQYHRQSQQYGSGEENVQHGLQFALGALKGDEFREKFGRNLRIRRADELFYNG